MSFEILYTQPVLLARDTHRGKRLRRTPGPGPAARLHACFLAAGEFPEAAKEYVIAFVDGTAGEGAKREVSPIVLLGLRENENLFLPPATTATTTTSSTAATETTTDATVEPTRWDAHYIPAFVRRYPFAYTSGDNEPAVVIDAACEGLNDTEGELLVQDDGEAAPFLKQMIEFLNSFEVEVQRTRTMCQRLVELDLLRPVQVDVTLPGGATLSAGAVLVIDEARVKALPEAVAVELLRNGMLGLIVAQMISTSNVQRLTDRFAAREAPAATASNDAVA